MNSCIGPLFSLRNRLVSTGLFAIFFSDYNGLGGTVVSSRHQPHATNLITTLLSRTGKPQDLDAIHQDVREVKATLKKLLDHIFTRKADCDTPHARAPAGIQPGAPVTPTGHITAYLPLVLADFPTGVAGPVAHQAPVATVPISTGHPNGGTVKLALPALPAFQPPQCPVCRSNKK